MDKTSESENWGKLNWIQGVRRSVLKYMTQLPKVQRGREGDPTDEKAKRIKRGSTRVARVGTLA